MDKDFELNSCSDSWQMESTEYISDNFKTRSMGLVLDNASIIHKVYTAVFPTYHIIDKILDSAEGNILLFTHHPKIWDITKVPAFIDISEEYLKRLRENNISMYTLHTPLDKNGPYSTSVNLANVLDIKIDEEFCEDEGVKIGVIGSTSLNQIEQLYREVSNAIGHNVKLYQYGDNVIKNSKIALIAGGGNIPDILPLLHEKGINTFITGVTCIKKEFGPSVIFHQLADKFNINIIGATHYSTEKYACMEMVKYFNNLGLEAEFAEGLYDLEDI